MNLPFLFQKSLICFNRFFLMYILRDCPCTFCKEMELEQKYYQIL